MKKRYFVWHPEEPPFTAAASNEIEAFANAQVKEM